MENLYPHPPPPPLPLKSRMQKWPVFAFAWLHPWFGGGGGVGRGVCSLRTADAFPVVASLPFGGGQRSDDQKCVCCSQARGFSVPFYFVQDRKSSSSVPTTHLHPLPPKKPLSYTLRECLFYLFFFFILCFLRNRFSIAWCQFAGYIHFEYGWTVLDQEFDNNDLVWRHIQQLTPGRRLPC